MPYACWSIAYFRYHGVESTKRGTFLARICNQKIHRLGVWQTADEAARAYDEARIYLVSLRNDENDIALPCSVVLGTLQLCSCGVYTAL